MTAVIKNLKAMGVHLDVDDFGTGYSSLSYLQRMPIDAIKIDRQFISGLESGGNSLEIVKTIVSLARNLNMSVIGEGVETSEQLARLIELGCDSGQGYHLGRPMDAGTAEAFLREQSSAAIRSGLMPA
jgi:EAL domain-containing protein (putative c-di-GMP-specific phosphodiesterase class I)